MTSHIQQKLKSEQRGRTNAKGLGQGLVCGAAFLVMFAGGSVSADVSNHEPIVTAYNENAPILYAANDAEFRTAYPIKVFITRGRARDERRPSSRAHRRRANNLVPSIPLAWYLPRYIVEAPTPQEADLVIRVREADYDLKFRVIDVDHKDKKYKKSRRFLGGQCGTFRRAFYNKVKEKGEAYASYNMVVRLNGIGRDRENFTLRSAKNYSYGTNLRAATNCGFVNTGHMPSNGVAKLFAKSNEGYRNHMATRIRETSTKDLHRYLTKTVLKQADYFYTDLAARLSRQAEPHEEHSHKDHHGLQQSGYRPGYGRYRTHPHLSWGLGR